MAYSATYSSADLSAVSIDAIGAILAAAASLGTLIGLAILYGWLKKKL
jgi:hypothetical protein